MSCKNCNKKTNDIRIAENITVYTEGDSLKLTILDCRIRGGIRNEYASGKKYPVIYYTITVKNYAQLTKILDNIQEIEIEEKKIKEFTIDKIDKNTFKITIK